MTGARAAVLAALLLLAAPAAARAQVFIAERAAPQFEIGPLFVRAHVTPALGAMDVDVLWSISVPPTRSGAAVGQDLLLLWPSAIVPDRKFGPPDKSLERYVEARGFLPIESGRVELTAQNQYASGPGRREPIAGAAPFVTFVRERGPLGLTSPASVVRIPWDPRFANRTFLARLDMTTTGLLKPKPATWVEHLLWGHRHRLLVSFHEVRHRALFPLYLELRDRRVRLSEDPAQIIVNFSHSDRLKIDELSPQSARRQLSETRELTEVVSLFLDRSEGLNPQALTVQFGYFTRLQSWAPVLIPTLFFVLGNVAGVLIRTAAERVSKRWVGRLGFWRKKTSAPVPESTGVVLDRDTLARIVPGATTYQQVLDLCGHDVEERNSLAEPHRRTLVYRGRQVVPHRRRLAALLAAVTHWDVEEHEVEITLDHDVVTDVQARVRRSRLTDPRPA